MAEQTPFSIRRSVRIFDNLVDLSDFPMVPVNQVYIPGMPTDGKRVMALAEGLGLKLPTFSLSDIAKVFFQQHQGWLIPRVRDINPWPAEDDELWIPQPGGRGIPARQEVWTLAEVERMIFLLHREGIIILDRLIISWQILMWTAKGYGFHA